MRASLPSFLSSLHKTKSLQSTTFNFTTAPQSSRAPSYPIPPRSIFPPRQLQHKQSKPFSVNTSIIMSAVDNITDSLAATTIKDSGETNAAQNDAVIAIVAEGRRLYIGNLAYATTEGDLSDFFKGYLV
jgi:hypothetical protein